MDGDIVVEVFEHHPSQELASYAIYRQPSDYPDSFVVRKWRCDCGPRPEPTSEVMLVSDLRAARILLSQMGLVLFERDPNDDPCIVETWI